MSEINPTQKVLLSSQMLLGCLGIVANQYEVCLGPASGEFWGVLGGLLRIFGGIFVVCVCAGGIGG